MSNRKEESFNLVLSDGEAEENGGSGRASTEQHLERMLYIYNCIMDGWTVRKIDHHTFEFKKDRQQEIRDIYKRFFSTSDYRAATGNGNGGGGLRLSYLDAFLFQMTGKNYGGN